MFATRSHDILYDTISVANYTWQLRTSNREALIHFKWLANWFVLDVLWSALSVLSTATELPTCHWAPPPQPLEERWTVGRVCWSNAAVRPSDEPPLLPGRPESQSHRGYTCAAGDSVYPGPRCMPCCSLQKKTEHFYWGNQAKDEVTWNSQKLWLGEPCETVTMLNTRRQKFP